jgi:hypothetical protein
MSLLVPTSVQEEEEEEEDWNFLDEEEKWLEQCVNEVQQSELRHLVDIIYNFKIYS